MKVRLIIGAIIITSSFFFIIEASADDLMAQQHYPDHKEERFSERLSPPPRQTQDSSMSSNELIDLVQNLGPVFVICMTSFWFIKYQSDRMAKMQDEFKKTGS